MKIDIRKLRILTIVAPVAFVLALEVVSLLVLRPWLGTNSGLRLVVIFLILIMGILPFSLWVFAVIERQQRDLAESAELLRSVRDYAIFSVDPGGRVVGWSPGAERLKGYTGAEILGKPVSVFYLPEAVERGEPMRVLEEAGKQGQYETQGWRVRRDGTRFWADVLSTALYDDRNRVRGFTHIARDITEQREAAERISALNAQLEQRVAELASANREISRRVRELDAAHAAVRSISSALDLKEVLQTIADAARDLVESRYAALGVADTSGHITDFITSGITPEERAAIGPLPEGHGLLGALIQEGKPLRIASIATDPRSYGFPPHHPPMTSLLGVPIVFQGRPVGDLYLTDKIGADAFSQDDEELLLLLADHAAVAIEHARLYQEAQRARTHLQAWSAELEQKVAERTAEIARYTRDLTTRVLRAQEEERERLARELHDDTAQSLSTLLINLDLVDPLIPQEGEALRSSLNRIKSLAKRTLDTVRALSHDLRPTILDDFGLIAALRWYAEEYEPTFGVPVDLDIEEPPVPLAPEVELTLFRITQEALTNSGKYAGASRARVALHFSGACAHLTVADNGKGFDPSTVGGPTRKGGLGLYGMRERAGLLNADFRLESAVGAGTTIEVNVPLNNEGDLESPQRRELEEG